MLGPAHWMEIAPVAGGQRQSPIVIRAAEAQFSQSLRDKRLIISYNPATVNKLINSGQSLQACVDGNDSSAFMWAGYARCVIVIVIAIRR